MEITIIGSTLESYIVGLYLITNNKNLKINFLETNIDLDYTFDIGTNNLTQIIKDSNLDILDFLKNTNSIFKVANLYNHNFKNRKHYVFDFCDSYSTKKIYHVLKKYHNITNSKDDLTLQFIYPILSLCDLNLFTEYYHPYDIHKNTSYQIKYNDVVSYLKNKLLDFNNINFFKINEFHINRENKKIISIEFENIKISSDLYIDCSGKNRVLTSINDNYKQLNQILNVDKIINLKVDYKNKSKEMLPYVDSIGLNNGWLYKIFNYDYININFLHNSNYINNDFNNLYLNYDVLERNDLELELGFYDTAWNSNVLGLGSSICYLEPIEGNQLVLLKYLLPYLSHILNEEIITDLDKSKFNNFYKNKLEYEIFKIIDNRHHNIKRNDNSFWSYYLTEEYYENFKTYYKQNENIDDVLLTNISEYISEIYKLTNEFYEFKRNASFSYANYYHWLKNNIFEKE